MTELVTGATASLAFRAHSLRKRLVSNQRLAARAKALGFPLMPTHTEHSDDALRYVDAHSLAAAENLSAPEVPAGEVCLATVCTANYLHFARALVASFLRQHPNASAEVMVVDWDGESPLEVTGAELLPGRRLLGSALPYMLLKYDAIEVCCAAKPYVVEHLLRDRHYAKVLYLDADIYVFAPLAELVAALDSNNFVVVPHVLAPYPNPADFHVRPSLGDIAGAGNFNAGMFGVRNTEASLAFIGQWKTLVTAPGAFVTDLGLQHEQNFFNWVQCFADKVYVLRDPAYDVAYWNLHDRSLRCVDAGDEESKNPRWTVNGLPLVAFHFSGFSPLRPRVLSEHDRRYTLYLLPSVARLVDFYVQELYRYGCATLMVETYPYDTLPSGLRLSRRLRDVFKRHEPVLELDVDPWSPDGERLCCRALLRPTPGSGSLLPALLKAIYDERADLRIMIPEGDIRPERVLEWFLHHGVHETDTVELVDRFRPTIPKREAIKLVESWRTKYAGVFRNLAQPLGRDRSELLRRLSAAGLEEQAHQVRQLELEYVDICEVYLARRIWEIRADLHTAFPDPLFGDAERYGVWLDSYGFTDHLLSPTVGRVFREKAGERALARIFSYVNRTWPLMSAWPLAFVGVGTEALARALLGTTHHDLEFDINDIVMLLWTTEISPWAGLPLTLELAVNRLRSPSSYTEQGQEALLAPVLGTPQMREALTAYRRRFDQPCHRLDALAEGGAESSHSVLDPPAREQFMHLEAGNLTSPHPVGVNVFGYFKSSIGLGAMTRGLAVALRNQGIEVAPNIVGNVAMDRDLCIDDFTRTYRHQYGINIFVSYPHHHDRLLQLQPRSVVEPRRNIIYLAWEQRDGSPYWQEAYADFDEVWALSSYAATNLQRVLRREVLAVPCVVDFGSFPSAMRKDSVGLATDRYVFLYVFDANSSIVRKNPEAAISAFAAAFRRSEDVQLVIRASNSHRRTHRPVLERLERQAAATGLDIRFLYGHMGRNQLLELLSAADCYVSLHRAEGFGYTCAEAMYYCRPVIATGYSGNLDFMSEDNSLLVKNHEVEVTEPDGPFLRGSVWAEPSLDHAASLMRAAYLGEVPNDLGQRARQAVIDKLSAAAIGNLVGPRLRADLLTGAAASLPSGSIWESPGSAMPRRLRQG